LASGGPEDSLPLVEISAGAGMKVFFERAIANVTQHGDTDIFPFPIENHIFFDQGEETVRLLEEIHADFKNSLAKFPPSNSSALAPVSYTGFRWATQIDPLWNVYFLALVLSIGEQIESARIPKSDNVVFSYRYFWKDEGADIFDHAYNWRTFMEHSLKLAEGSEYVVSCDISEFYPRLNHHRLENALRQLNVKGDQPAKILDFLGNYSGTYSFGIPVGGPAARMLSEAVLNQIDRLLRSEGIKFCRFADDYHLFCDTYQDAFRSLVFLSERLLQNQGLQLQKAKTRILSGKEFLATSPLGVADDESPDSENPGIQEQSHKLMRLSLRFDPYSPTAADDYEALRAQLQKFDILSLLKSELVKSRVHISLSRRIVAAIRFIDETQRDDAVLSLILNEDLLYPIYANALLVAKTLFSDLKEDTRQKIIEHIRQLISSKSYVLLVEHNLAYAIRLISCADGPENEEILNRVYKETRNILIRRDIILAMAKWRASYWLSDLKSDFRTLSPAERRAFIVASYVLKDEGSHWRDHIKRELSPFENLVREWASQKVQLSGWSVPL
jgi:hypothetical protein